ncbi:MAG: type II toxin-antitoxin system RelE/ParE family toxin [Acidobacteria bacterium]|nr:type II toxin-antitoxin system RelE/ParE family toxin [Acidobacteriota bacterium]
MELQSYLDRLGRNPFERWYEALDDHTRARVAVALDRLSRGNVPAKSVGAGVLELRMDFGPGYRVYFGKDGEFLVILLAGGTKRRQQTDIEAAQQLWREYKQRKRES